MKEIAFFTEQEKKRFKRRIKTIENEPFYQFLKSKYQKEIKQIDKTIEALKCEQVEEFKKYVRNQIKQLLAYRLDLINNCGFFFEE